MNEEVKVIPKYCIYKSTKEKIEIIEMDFDTKLITVKGYEGHERFIPFTEIDKTIDFDYDGISISDLFPFLRAIYPPSEVVKHMCDARGL